MSAKKFAKDGLAKFISKLAEGRVVYAPQEENSVLTFRPVEDPSNVSLDLMDRRSPPNTRVPPKALVFPQREILFYYEKDGGNVKVEDALVRSPPPEQVILGARPCDARSFQLLKMFFEFGKYKDVYFTERLAKTLVVAYACNDPKASCFCTSVRGGPFDPTGVDLLLVNLGDRYVLVGESEAGEAVLEQLGEFEDASSEDLEKVAQLEAKAKESFEIEIDLEGVEDDLSKLIDHELWQHFSQFCLGCGTCSFLCPTCHCYDVVDENIDEKHGVRVRIWDTCQFPLFTEHGSGHNPRPDKKSRARQRINHKFYYYPKNYGIIGCVGCGRCSCACPIGSDTVEHLQDVKATVKEVQG
ncbi:MAG: 4Fe-4S dicluster domain-containing protein [Promethearchaeota archaeon]